MAISCLFYEGDLLLYVVVIDVNTTFALLGALCAVCLAVEPLTKTKLFTEIMYSSSGCSSNSFVTHRLLSGYNPPKAPNLT